MHRKLIVAAMLLLCVVVADGCQETKETSKNAMALVKGDADAVVDRTPDQVMEAARAAAGDLGLIVIANATTQADEKVVRTLTLRTTEDRKVTVRVTAEGDKAARVTVNTGLFGDSELRTRVMDKIKGRLGIAIQSTTTAPAT